MIRVARFPEAGETIDASQLSVLPGGKGGNQAIAVARLGVGANVIGCVGDDAAGKTICDGLRESGVVIDEIRRVTGVPSGSAFVLVDVTGENRIVIVAGSNGEVGAIELSRLQARLNETRVLLLQFEVPMEAVVQAAKIAHQANVTVILDPAPALALPRELVGLVDIITPNESEAEILTGGAVHDDLSAARCAEALRMHSGAKAVIIKRGAKGVMLDSGNGARIVRAPKVAVVDTTAAGDTFNGALAAAICNGSSLDEAVDLAVIAGAISVTKPGSQHSIPTRDEVYDFMKRRPA